MGRWLGGVEQRLTFPDVFDVVDTQMWVLEQVADLVIDLERPFIVKEIGIEPFLSHVAIVLQVTTDDYVSVVAGVVVSAVNRSRMKSRP